MPGSESHLPLRKGRSGQDQTLLATAYRFWQLSYASDYLGLALLLAAYMVLQFFVEPFHRLFYLHDPRIQYPHAEIERVPVPWLFVYAGATPAALLVLWAIVTRPPVQKAHITILGLFVSLILTSFITDVIKNAVGRPRPDLLARCKPAPGTAQDELLTFEVCTEPNHHVLHDGWRSFPSGHSSFAFSGLGYFGLFTISQLHVLRPRADLARVLLAITPFLGAALIAISRLEDYRHDVFDVVVGSLLGALVAYSTWRRYFPPLSSQGCAEPYASQTDGSQPFIKIRDEEELVGGSREYELNDGEDRYPFSGQRVHP